MFSATEKVLFGGLVIIAGITSLFMLQRVNSYFSVEIPAYGGELHEGEIGLPHTINPVLAITDVDRDISSLVYSGLMKYVDNVLVPDLAKSYTISKDGLTYDFILKDNIQFHDGSPLTSDDIVFTIQKIQDPALKSPRRIDWLNITATSVSPTAIRFVLKQPYSPFLTNTTIGIIPKNIWKNINNEQFIFNKYNINPIGSGPFKIDNIIRDATGIPTTYKLSAWSKYYDRRAYLNNITFHFFDDSEKALTALNNKTIDSIASISSNQAKNLVDAGDKSYKILSTPLPRIFGIFLNQNQSPVLADKTVRKALDLSIDRESIVATVLNNYGISIDSPLTFATSINKPIINDSSMSTSTVVAIDPAIIEENIKSAQTLLEKSGWKKNSTSGVYEQRNSKNVVTQTLAFDIYTADIPDLKKATEMVKDSWDKLGAQVNIKVFESSDLYQNVIRTRKYDALLFGELIGKDHDFYAFWHSSQRNAPGLNITMYTNSRVDKLLEDIRGTNDEEVRTAKYRELSQLIQSDTPVIFLYSPDFIYVTSSQIHGIKLNSVTTPSDRFSSVADWYVQTESVWKIFSN